MSQQRWFSISKNSQTVRVMKHWSKLLGVLWSLQHQKHLQKVERSLYHKWCKCSLSGLWKSGRLLVVLYSLWFCSWRQIEINFSMYVASPAIDHECPNGSSPPSNLFHILQVPIKVNFRSLHPNSKYSLCIQIKRKNALYHFFHIAFPKTDTTVSTSDNSQPFWKSRLERIFAQHSTSETSGPWWDSIHVHGPS